MSNHQALEPTPDLSANPSFNAGVVFVVDDEEMVTRSIRAMLSLETDHEVYCFNSPMEALAAIATTPPDVVISDFLMPGMDGIAFLQEVKARLPETTAILLTGYADKENAIQAINKVGLYRYLEKPWDNDQLKVSITNGVERTRLLANLRETIVHLTDAQAQLADHNARLETIVEERTQDLKKTYSQLDSIVRHTADGIITVSRQLQVTSANPAAQELIEHHLGDAYSEELYGAPVQSLFTEPTSEQILALFSHKKAIHTDEAVMGSIPVEMSISPLPDEEGFVLVVRDISKRKEADRLREDFVSTLTHDLRTPLLAAIQTLEFFIDGSLGPLEDRQRELLTMLIQSNREMLGLVNVLLEVYKYESGRQRLVFDAVDVGELIGQICKELDALAQSRQLTLLFENPDGVNPMVWGDKQELRRVFVNLIGNGLHYTPSGGTVKIRFSAKSQPKQQLQVDVIDNGRGIPAQDLPLLFQRFSQGTSKKRSSGTGLGLYLSRQIVEAHQGSVSVHSEEGKGSCFTVILPVKP